jgi:CTP synthase (UTP-ammonia lyase)
MRLLALGDRDPSVLTHREVDATLSLLGERCECAWTATDSSAAREPEHADAIWLLSGSPYRDTDAVRAAIRHSLRTGTPFLGTCAGFQYACIELLSELAGLSEASHAESDPGAPMLAVVPLACSLYGEWRTVLPVPGSLLAQICGRAPFEGFHYCGFGLADAFRAPLERAGVLISAEARDAGAEAIELPPHPFFMATAFQPQVGSSSSLSVHPLLDALLGAAEAASEPAR